MRKHPTLYWGPVRAGQQLEPGHAPQTALGAGDQALLGEAIRFFNFEHPVIVRAGWEPLRFRAAELTEMRANIHDALFEYLLIATRDENLSALVQSTKLQATSGSTKAAPAPKTKSKAASPRKSRVFFNHATRARLLLRAILLPDWRRPGRDPPDLRSLKWDQIAAAIDSLRQSTRRSVIEQKLQASFGPSLLNPAGGDQGLALADPSLIESGLAEKLYFQVGAVVTPIGPRYIGWPSQPVVGPNGVPFTLHTDVKAAADAVVLAALPFIGPSDDDFPDLLGNWLEMIDVMENWLSVACNSSLGGAVGAPWGLALTATLRAYVVDALLGILTLSLPLSRLHDQAAAPPKGTNYKYHFPFGPSKWRTDYKSSYNAMIAIGLWEAATGKLAPHCNKGNDGFLTADPRDAVLNVVSAWRPQDVGAFWGSGLGAPHADLAKYLVDEAKRYFLWTSLGDKAQKNGSSAPRDGSDGLNWKDAPRLEANEIFDTWPAHPRFFRDTKQRSRPSDAKDEDQTGTLWSQLSLFVMSTIATKLMSAVGADGKAFLEGGGSLMWGGCHYTHREHRFGSVFDIGHRYPHPPWKLQSLGDKKKMLMYLGVQPHEPRANESESIEYDRFFYPKDAMDKTVAEALAEFKVGTAFAAIEKQYLLGTPLQYTPQTKPSSPSANKLQVNMIGHIALLLTAPYKMIMAAPIMHLRSIQLIGDAFSRDELSAVRKIESFLWPPEFYFKPEDHNDHWHVVYYALDGSSGDPKVTKGPPARGEGKTIGDTAVATLCTFWRDLGVPLDKFVAYLEGLALAEGGAFATVGRAATEAKALMRVLKPLIAKAPSNSDKQLTTRLAPVVRLLQLPRYVECAPSVSNRLKAIRIPVRDPGAPVNEENEYDRWQSEQSTDPGVSY
jgi:hypothetical protein